LYLRDSCSIRADSRSHSASENQRFASSLLRIAFLSFPLCHRRPEINSLRDEASSSRTIGTKSRFTREADGFVTSIHDPSSRRRFDWTALVYERRIGRGVPITRRTFKRGIGSPGTNPGNLREQSPWPRESRPRPGILSNFPEHLIRPRTSQELRQVSVMPRHLHGPGPCACGRRSPRLLTPLPYGLVDGLI